MRIIDRKHLLVSYHSTPRPDGRKRKVRHDKRASSIYVQILGLEIVGWYR